MSILNDKQIRALCLTATHIAEKENGTNSTLVSKHDGSFYILESGINVAAESFEAHGLVLKDLEKPYTRSRMITPFEPKQVRHTACDDVTGVGTKKVISYGTSSMGYDVRLANQFKVFTNINSAIIDPLNMSDDAYVDVEGDFVIIPPNSYALGHTIEYFDIPRDIMVVCLGKSTYARTGIIVNVTPIEPGFKGNVVIEVANQTTLPVKVYANQGISQFLFFRGEPCEISYNDRGGKYQGQTGIQTAIV